MGDIVIYPAGALFNSRETYFNSRLVESLETIGYKTNFPQRDGFEFGRLTKALSDKLPDEHISLAVRNAIYFLDMGKFIPNSDVILANFDEPLDGGEVVETCYAKMMGKFVLGFRTDVRSPYGKTDDKYGGMHFFPAYQCQKFIRHYIPSRTPEERESQFSSFVIKIDDAIQEAGIQHKDELPDHALSNPHITALLEGAEILFKDIEDIHTEKGLELIASRYAENCEYLAGLALDEY